MVRRVHTWVGVLAIVVLAVIAVGLVGSFGYVTWRAWRDDPQRGQRDRPGDRFY